MTMKDPTGERSASKFGGMTRRLSCRVAKVSVRCQACAAWHRLPYLPFGD